MRDSPSNGSNDSTNEGAGALEAGFDVCGAGVRDEVMKFDLAGRASGPGRIFPSTFFQGVDWPRGFTTTRILNQRAAALKKNNNPRTRKMPAA